MTAKPLRLDRPIFPVTADGKPPHPQMLHWMNQVTDRLGGPASDRIAETELESLGGVAPAMSSDEPIWPVQIVATAVEPPLAFGPLPAQPAPECVSASALAPAVASPVEPPFVTPPVWPAPRSGTWTPVITNSSASGTHTYTVQTGYWEEERPGLIWFVVNVGLSAYDASGGPSSGQTRITGFPFTALYTVPYHVPVYEFVALAGSGEGNHPFAQIDAGNSYFGLETQGNNTATPLLTHAHMTNDTRFSFQGTLRTT